MLARDLREAVEDLGVAAVVLEVDSPGGEAMGVCELGALIAGMRKRKPIYAYADGLCASGAYWLASACESITASPTAILGSIGVVMAYRRSRADMVEFVSSQSPHKRPDVDTEEGRGQVQRVVDDLAAVFVAEGARYRGVSEEQVLRDFGSGGVKVGRAAVKAGLADALGTQEGLLARIRAGKPVLAEGGRRKAEGRKVRWRKQGAEEWGRAPLPLRRRR